MNRISLIFVFVALFATVSFAQTNGELSVSVNTSKAGGEYAPRNIVAIWVEDASGKFVKTLLSYAEKRKGDLTNWKTSTLNAGSQYNVVDAITSATKSAHDVRTCTWNGTDYKKVLVTDGKYKICMELADGSRKNTTFEIEKGPNTVSLTPADVPSFSAIKLNWVPVVKTSVKVIDNTSDFMLYPNPTRGLVDVKGKSIENVSVYNSHGQQVISTGSSSFDLSLFPKGVYLIGVKTQEKTVYRKLIKE